MRLETTIINNENLPEKVGTKIEIIESEGGGILDSHYYISKEKGEFFGKKIGCFISQLDLQLLDKDLKCK